jgi:hypothetical protein
MSTAQWANIGEGAGAIHALLERVLEQVAVDAIDYVWIFPPRRIAIGESTVLVVGAFDQDPARRRVLTAHYTVSRNRKGVADVKAHFDEHGSAPEAAVPRIVQGVLRRLGEDAEAEPRAEQIGGDSARWDALVVELGGRPRVADAEHADTPAEGSLPDGEAESPPQGGIPGGHEVPPAAPVAAAARLDADENTGNGAGDIPPATDHFPRDA